MEQLREGCGRGIAIVWKLWHIYGGAAYFTMNNRELLRVLQALEQQTDVVDNCNSIGAYITGAAAICYLLCRFSFGSLSCNSHWHCSLLTLYGTQVTATSTMIFSSDV